MAIGIVHRFSPAIAQRSSGSGRKHNRVMVSGQGMAYID